MQTGRDIQRMLIPETILPSQWYPDRTIDGARRLWLATLDEAVNCLNLKAVCNANPISYQRATPEQRKHMKLKRRTYLRVSQRNRLAQEAEDWILSNDKHVGSFLFVSTALGLNPQWLRRKLGAVA